MAKDQPIQGVIGHWAPSECLIIKGGSHCANNFRYKYSPQSADWIAGHLGALVS